MRPGILPKALKRRKLMTKKKSKPKADTNKKVSAKKKSSKANTEFMKRKYEELWLQELMLSPDWEDFKK